MNRAGVINAVISPDSDGWPFGASMLLRQYVTLISLHFIAASNTINLLVFVNLTCTVSIQLRKSRTH